MYSYYDELTNKIFDETADEEGDVQLSIPYLEQEIDDNTPSQEAPIQTQQLKKRRKKKKQTSYTSAHVRLIAESSESFPEDLIPKILSTKKTKIIDKFLDQITDWARVPNTQDERIPRVLFSHHAKLIKNLRDEIVNWANVDGKQDQRFPLIISTKVPDLLKYLAAPLTAWANTNGKQDERFPILLSNQSVVIIKNLIAEISAWAIASQDERFLLVLMSHCPSLLNVLVDEMTAWSKKDNMENIRLPLILSCRYQAFISTFKDQIVAWMQDKKTPANIELIVNSYCNNLLDAFSDDIIAWALKKGESDKRFPKILFSQQSSLINRITNELAAWALSAKNKKDRDKKFNHILTSYNGELLEVLYDDLILWINEDKTGGRLSRMFNKKNKAFLDALHPKLVIWVKEAKKNERNERIIKVLRLGHAPLLQALESDIKTWLNDDFDNKIGKFLKQQNISLLTAYINDAMFLKKIQDWLAKDITREEKFLTRSKGMLLMNAPNISSTTQNKSKRQASNQEHETVKKRNKTQLSTSSITIEGTDSSATNEDNLFYQHTPKTTFPSIHSSIPAEKYAEHAGYDVESIQAPEEFVEMQLTTEEDNMLSINSSSLQPRPTSPLRKNSMFLSNSLSFASAMLLITPSSKTFRK